MKKLMLTAALCSILALAGCASTASLTELAGNPMISSLTGSVPGLDPTKAVGIAGSLLDVASGKLSKADMSQVTDLIPHAKDIRTQAAKLGGMKEIKSIDDAKMLASKIGVTSEQATAVASGMTDFITKKGGADLGNKFAAAIKP